MTDEECDARLIKIAIRLCDRGVPTPGFHDDDNVRPRLRKILDEDDAFQARWLVPALIDIIERSGLAR